MVVVGGERTAAVSRHGMGWSGKWVRKPGQRPRRRVEGSSSAPSHPLETPHATRTRVHANRGTPPPTPLVAIFAGAHHLHSPLIQTQGPRRPAYTGAMRGGRGSRRLSGVVSSGAPPARRFCARVLFRPVVSFFGAARYGTSAVYASAHSHSISRPAKSSEAG